MDIETIKDLRAKITPGNWETLTDMDHGFVDIISDNDEEIVAQDMSENDSNFLMQAPVMIDFLLSEVERLEGEVNELIYKNGGCPACKGYDRLHRNCILR